MSVEAVAVGQRPFLNEAYHQNFSVLTMML